MASIPYRKTVKGGAAPKKPISFLEAIPQVSESLDAPRVPLKRDAAPVEDLDTRQIGPAPTPVDDIETFRPWANVNGEEDDVDYLPQKNIVIPDLIKYPGTDKRLVKDVIMYLPENAAAEVSFNKEHRELVTMYGGRPVYNDASNLIEYGNVSQKAVIFDKTRPVDVSDGLFKTSGGSMIMTTSVDPATSGGNIVGTAFSGIQYMAAKQGPVTGNGDVTGNSYIFRLPPAGTAWQNVTVTVPSGLPASYYQDYAINNTDIKYLNFRWFGLRSITKSGSLASIDGLSSDSNITDTHVLNFISVVNPMVKDLFSKMQLLYSPCKDASSLAAIIPGDAALAFPDVPNDFYQQIIPYELPGEFKYDVKSVSVIPLDAQHIRADGCDQDHLAITGMISISGTSTRTVTVTHPHQDGLQHTHTQTDTRTNVVYERAFVLLIRNYALEDGTAWNLYYPEFAADQYQTASAYPARNDTTQAAIGAIQGGIQGWRVDQTVDQVRTFLDIVPTRARVISSSGVNNVLLMEAAVVQNFPDTPVAIAVKQSICPESTGTVSISGGTVTYATSGSKFSGPVTVNGNVYTVANVAITGVTESMTGVTMTAGSVTTECSVTGDITGDVVRRYDNTTTPVFSPIAVNTSGSGLLITTSSTASGLVFSSGTATYTGTFSVTAGGHVFTFTNPVFTADIGTYAETASIALSTTATNYLTVSTGLTAGLVNCATYTVTGTSTNTTATLTGYASLTVIGLPSAVSATPNVTIAGGTLSYPLVTLGASGFQLPAGTISNTGLADQSASAFIAGGIAVATTGTDAGKLLFTGSLSGVFKKTFSDVTIALGSAFNGQICDTDDVSVTVSSASDPLGSPNASGTYTLTVKFAGETIKYTDVVFTDGTASATTPVLNAFFEGRVTDGMLVGIITGIQRQVNAKTGPLTLPFRHIAMISPIVFPSEQQYTDVPVHDNAVLHHSMILGDAYADMNVEAPSGVTTTPTPDVAPYHLNILSGPLALHLTYVYNAIDDSYIPDTVLPVTIGTQSLNARLDTYHKATGVWSGNDWSFIFRTLPQTSGVTCQAPTTSTVSSVVNTSVSLIQRPRFFTATVMDIPRADYRGLYVEDADYHGDNVANLNRQIAVTTTSYDKSVVYNAGQAIRSAGIAPSYMGAPFERKATPSAQAPKNYCTCLITGGLTYIVDQKEGNSTVSTTYILRQAEPKGEPARANNLAPRAVLQPLTMVDPCVKNIYNIKLPEFEESTTGTVFVTQVNCCNGSTQTVTNGAQLHPFRGVVSTVRANVEGTHIRDCNAAAGVFPAKTGIVSQVGLDEVDFANTYQYGEIVAPMNNNHACAFCTTTRSVSEACPNLTVIESRYVVARTRNVAPTSPVDPSPIVYTPPVSSSVSAVKWDGKTWLGKTTFWIPTLDAPLSHYAGPQSIFDVAAVTVNSGATGSLSCFFIAVGTPVGYCNAQYAIWVSDGQIHPMYGMQWYAVNVSTCGRTMYRVKVVSTIESEKTTGIRVVATGDDGFFATWRSGPITDTSGVTLDDVVNVGHWCAACLSSVNQSALKMDKLPIYDFSAIYPPAAWKNIDYGVDYPDAPLNNLPIFTFMFGTPVSSGPGTQTKLLSGYFRGLSGDSRWQFIDVHTSCAVPAVDNCVQTISPYAYSATNYEDTVFLGGVPGVSPQNSSPLWQMVPTPEAVTGGFNLVDYNAVNGAVTTPALSAPPLQPNEVIVRLESYDNYIFALVRGNGISRIYYSGYITEGNANWYELAVYPYELTDMCINLGYCCDPRDEEPVLCALTNTTITLPPFLCPDEVVAWNIIYRFVPVRVRNPVEGCTCRVTPTCGGVINGDCAKKTISDNTVFQIIHTRGFRQLQQHVNQDVVLKHPTAYDYRNAMPTPRGFAIGINVLNKDSKIAVSTPGHSLKQRGCIKCSAKPRVKKY